MTLKKICKEVDEAMYGMEKFMITETETSDGNVILFLVKGQQGSKGRAKHAISVLKEKFADEGLIFKYLVVDNFMFGH